MSDMPSSVTYMTQATRNGLHHESFHTFFECWLSEQNHNLQELVHAAGEHDRQRDLELQHGRTESREEVNERVLWPLLDRVVRHYEQYYGAKSRWAKNDILSMFNPSWLSSLEDAFLWIGGWRPSMAFHVLYSKAGLQLEARLDELLRGLTTGDLGDLSHGQLERVDELQRATIREEKELTEKLAKHQETVADSSMVELTHVVTEMMREGREIAAQDHDGGERVEATLAPKEEGLVEILRRADELRLKTLKEVLGVLTPIQGVHFLIAAAELHLRVHEWGKKRDAMNGQRNGAGHGLQHS